MVVSDRLLTHITHTVMNATQIMLLQQSFKKVEPIAEVAAGLFYDRLFKLDPSLRALFKGDLTDQGRKLMHAISVVVKGISKLDTILPTVQDLGRRHAGYGVQDEHYDTVESALLWTLKQGLGTDFTPEVENAWATAYGLLAGAMKEAAHEPAYVVAT